MKTSYEIIKNAVNKIGVKTVAAELGVSPSLVYKWCEESEDTLSGSKNSGSANPLDRICKIY